MNYFSKLFVRTPFDQLLSHMEKVVACLAKTAELLQVFEEASLSELDLLAARISEFEHEADLIKNDIRATLPKSFLFQFDRSNFLEILTLQDDLADVAEDIAAQLTTKKLHILPEMKEDFKLYVSKNMETVWDVKEIVLSIDELVEASFGGRVAEKVRAMIDQTAYREHEADLMKKKIIKLLFNMEGMLTFTDFYLWMRLIEDIGNLSHFAEKLALRFGMLLDTK
jgi:predicted phosphate transport protein (TIGR00153 family)